MVILRKIEGCQFCASFNGISRTSWLGQAWLKLGFDLILISFKFGFSRSSSKLGKNHPIVPPLDHFQGDHKNCSSITRTISASRQSFCANLTTFERRSGLKFFSLLKIKILKIGECQNFKVIGLEEMPILVQGRHKCPQLKGDRLQTLILTITKFSNSIGGFCCSCFCWNTVRCQ